MSTRYAILGLLNQRPMHGYELKKEFEQSVSYIWSINIGQLYTLLKKMEEEGVIEKELVPQENRPDKLVYKVTDRGNDELHEWLSTPVLQRKTKDEFYLKMMFLTQTDKASAENFINEQINTMEQQLADFKQIKDNHIGEEDNFMWLLLDSSIMHFEVDIKWLKTYKERMLQ